jgi:type IV secretion system protein TrbL
MMKKTNALSLLLTTLFIFCSTAHAAATPIDPTSTVNIVFSAMAPAGAMLQEHAWKWLSGFMLVQFIFTNIKAVTSGGEIDNVWAKLLGSILWFSMCFYLMENGPGFIQKVGDQMFSLVGGGLPSPGKTMLATTAMSSILAVVASSVGIFSATAGQLILYVLLIILGVGMYFSFKILMIQLELALIVMLSPLSFALLGLNALKDQGIAPLKSLISLAYRIILTSVILSAFSQVSGVVSSILSDISIASLTLDGLGKVTDSILSGLAAYILLAFLLYKSDSIAAGLASGGTSMGTADMAGAVAAGVAGGMAAHAATAATAGAAGNAAKGASSMSDMIKGLRSQVASAQNAGGVGSGSSGSGSPSPKGMNSLGDAPKKAATPSNPSAKDLQQIAKDAGALPSSNKSSTPANGTTSSGGGSATNGASEKPRDPKADRALVDKLLKGPEPKGGTGESAGISGTSPTGNAAGGLGLEKQLGALVEQLQKQGQSKPGVGDRLSSLNDHIGRESAATHVSINTHGHD